MEFLVVSDSKLKIMMSREDMKKYSVDGEDIDYEDSKVRRSFWKILDAARAATGFQASGDKVLIQFYPSKEGCEIFVTKLGLVSESAERSISKSTKVAVLKSRSKIYKFSSLDAMIDSSRLLDPEMSEGAPRAFSDENDGYYIIVEERVGGKLSEITPLIEFGTELPQNLASYIKEHGREIDFPFLGAL